MEHTIAKDPKEIRYIKQRKTKAFFESLCFCACRIFPIKKNLVSVCTFEGKGGFGCNPKYLVRAIHQEMSEAEFVWFVDDMNKEFPEYIRKVPNTLMSRAYWLTRSKVWIDNYRKPYGTRKRKGQYYLNVNHYTLGFKCTGLHRGAGFSEMAYLVSKNDSDMIDDIVIDSDWCESCWDEALVYEGSYLKTGAPRCDVLYGDRSVYHEEFCKKHNIPLDSKIIMYAPTFREGAKNGKRSVYSAGWSIDFKRLLDKLEQKFGGEWYLCVRVHPQLAPSFDKYDNPDIKQRIINESHGDDLYEILAGMDAYITDYSSAAFEAGFGKIPVFLYADDIEDYVVQRGNMMWDFHTDALNYITNNKEITKDIDVVLPFSMATNNEELEKNIECFDKRMYEKKLDDFHHTIGLVFTGKASASLAQYICQMMK